MARERAQEVGRGAWILWGVGAFVVGMMLLTNPATTAVFIVRVVAVFWLVGGVIDVFQALFTRRGQGRGWTLFGGVIGILGGLVILGHPILGVVIATATLYLFAAISAMAFGLSNLFGARGERGWTWGRFFLGILQLLIGVLMLWHPVIGSLEFTTVLAIAAIAGGGGMVMLAFRSGSQPTREASS